MATYYVRSGGSDGNTGLGAGTGQAWATIGKALGATGITGGDTLYIAAGTYREVVTIGGTYSSATYIYGDPTSSLFSGVTAGEVRITPSGSDNAVSTSFALTATSKNNLNFRDLIIGGMNITTSSNMTIERCLLFSTSATTQAFVFTNTYPPVNYNTTIKQCIVTGTVAGIEYKYSNYSAPWTAGLYISDCFITGLNAVYINNTSVFLAYPAGSVIVYNSVLMGYIPWNMPSGYQTTATSGNNIKLYNCLVYATGTYAFYNGQNSNMDENYNRIYGVNTRTFAAQGANTTVASWSGLEFGQSLLQGYGPLQIFGNTFNSPNATAGTASGAPVVDMYNQAWNVTPDIGVAIYRNIGGVGAYLPSERNASTITIAPGSTSQSIELYLGATGLTFATSGLSAYYVRNREAPTPITLVTQTATGTWASGGFAEISSAFTPGVYRLDLPDAAVAAGADDVTVVVRGASGTNGAVMTIKLSSGGLTAAQTAQAVLDATASTHNNIGSIGASIQDKAGYSLSTPQSFSTTGSVGSVTGNVAGNVTGTVGGVAGNVTGNIAGSVATVASPNNIIDGVWDEQRVGHTASGSFGEKLQTNALADEMLARDLGSGLNAGTAEERTVRSALRAIRNKVNVGSSQMVVKKEDDTTDAWTASVTTTAVSSNVSGIDPN